MKRVLLVVGCFLAAVGFLALVWAGSVWAVERGQDCPDCRPVVRMEKEGAVNNGAVNNGAVNNGAVTNGGPAIDFRKTVGLNPQLCASTNEVTVPSGGGTVYYCYNVHNAGDVTLTLHTVVDDKLGTLIGPGFPVNLVPGAVGFFTIEVGINETTVNSATWRAYNPGPVDVVTGSDMALVTVEGPILGLTATNDGPTALGRETTLGTIISGGGFESYAWDFGDGVTGTGATTTHVYPALGVYTAVVTATNSFNSLTATTVVTVIHPPVYLPAVFRP